jgi:hypothetical protein
MRAGYSGVGRRGVLSERSSDSGDQRSYALELADGSYQWYRGRATRCRRAHRILETAVLVVSAAVPASAAMVRDDARIPAVLGAVVVVLGGLRAVFHWHENYVRFNAAREAVEGQRRRYHTGSAPYDDPSTRDQTLAAAVTEIEQGEMTAWIRLATDRPKA